MSLRPIRGLHPGATWAEEPARWYALRTRARHEKQVDERLRLRQFEVFLPLVSRERQWHDRKKVVSAPLFPGYVFSRFRLKSTAEVLGVPGVADVVRTADAPAPIRDDEIENVRRVAELVAETGTLPRPTPMISRGQRVRVVSGPLEGIEGLVVQKRGGGRIQLQVGLGPIGQGLKFELEAGSVRSAERVN